MTLKNFEENISSTIIERGYDYFQSGYVNNLDEVETENLYYSNLSAIEIENIDIIGKLVTVNMLIKTPTPCWTYYDTQKTQSESNNIGRIVGQYNGEPCIQILSFFVRSKIIMFFTGGEKLLSFWQNDSTYI